jgi:hypothetical protein
MRQIFTDKETLTSSEKKSKRSAGIVVYLPENILINKEDCLRIERLIKKF